MALAMSFPEPLALTFGPPTHAVQLRITPQLRNALLSAKRNGAATSMRIDRGSAVRDFYFLVKDWLVKGCSVLAHPGRVMYCYGFLHRYCY